MLLTIHDANLQKVAFVDNSKQNTLNYYGDTWTRSLQTGSSTFEFTVFKKAIKSDTALNKAYQFLNERAWVSFKYKGRSYIFNVMTVEEDEQIIKCYCENLNLELINELANPYKATKAMSFVEYCEEFGILNYSHLSVGINEVSDRKLTLEWSGQDTKLARLLSLANRFDAEIEFDTQLNADSTIKKFCINVYHENDDDHQGVGQIRNDIHLKYGNNITSINRKIDKTSIFNSIHPTGKRTIKNEGKEDTEEVVTIQGLNDDWKKFNKDGICEFYQIGAYLVAPISMQLYPSTFSQSTSNLDQYIRKDFTYDTDNPKKLRELAYKELKKHCYPAITYEVDGYVDVEIGDTVKIHDAGFAPLLTIQARVSEQKISFSNPNSNKTTFSNFKALENQLSDGIKEAFERLFEQSIPYDIKLSTDNGIAFKNSQGQTIVTPTLMRGNKVINSGWRWTVGGVIKSTSARYIVNASDIDQKMVLTVSAWIDNKEVASEQLTLINTSDGTAGKTQYLHRAWANSADGRDGFSTSDSTNKRYLGTLTDFNEPDSQDSTKYKWTALFGTTEQSGNILLDSNAGWRNKHRQDFILAEPLKLGKQYTLSAKWWRSDKSTLSFGIRENPSDSWQWVSLAYSFELDVWNATFTSNKNLNAGDTVSFFTVELEGTGNAEWAVLTVGAVPMTSWQPHWSETQKDIDSKADQGLTQEQLNALNEKAGVIQAELEAKASADTLDNWIKAYKDFVQANDEARAQSEADLISASQRVSNIAKDLGELSDRWNFIDTYMSSSNEGLVIGKNDGSSSMLFSPTGRISMYSAGVEVMYISQGVIHIENGIFSKTVQIGRFREEQYHLNPDMNVIRYVGGA